MVDGAERAPSVNGSSRRARELAEGVFWLALGGRTQTNVYLVLGDRYATVVDAGWAADGPVIRAAVRHVLGAHRRPASILLTHAHPDHSGSARELAQAWECPIHVHPDDLPIASGDFLAMSRTAGPLDRWLILPFMRAVGRRRRAAIIARSSLAGMVYPLVTENGAPNLQGWRWLPTPGHSPGHVSLFRERDGVLLTGDAVVNLQVNSVFGALFGRVGLSGPPWYTTWDRAAAARSILELARLEPRVLGSGHGPPLVGPGVALRLKELASRVARSRALASAGTVRHDR
jgi:glyoxylase-like metal-dependent hydrolase (beta-lactamase superfamily II)